MTFPDRYRRWLAASLCFLIAFMFALAPIASAADKYVSDHSVTSTAVINIAPGVSASDLASMSEIGGAPDLSGPARKVVIVNKGILITGHGNTVIVEKRTVYDPQPGERTLTKSTKRKGLSEDCEELHRRYVAINSSWTSGFDR